MRLLFSRCGLALAAIALAAPLEGAKSETSPAGEATPRPATPRKKTATKKSTPNPFYEATPRAATPRKKPRSTEGAKADAAADETTPKPVKKKTTPNPGAKATPRATKAEKATPSPDAAKTGASSKTTAAQDPAAPPPQSVSAAPNASLSPADLVEFNEQPPRVKKLITSALDLTKQQLTYAYGSADPANGGLDCSGFIHYVLRQNGVDEVPRQASEQYSWLRKQHEFDAVLSKKKSSFELDDLKPGDLLFWTGTYTTDRDPPVTHTMIYLGTEKATKQRVMAGSSDGRTYRGQSRWGVSVFDFQGGQTSADPAKQGRGGFVGYATIPGMRE